MSGHFRQMSKEEAGLSPRRFLFFKNKHQKPRAVPPAPYFVRIDDANLEAFRDISMRQKNESVFEELIHIE